MSDYSKLTDSEIDRLAAEMFGEIEIVHTRDRGGNGQVDIVRFGSYTFSFSEYSSYDIWNPTKNAQQIQDYLFPKLEEKGSYILMERITHPFTFNITIRFGSNRQVMKCTAKKDQINRITTECCVEAYEKLKEGEG